MDSLPSTSSMSNDTNDQSEEKIQIKLEPDDSEIDTKSETLTENSNSKTDIPRKPPDRPSIEFKCEKCGFHELCHYKGMNPPFSNRIEFFEECYVMKDPFSPPPGRHSSKSNCEYFIVLGAQCTLCQRIVCKAPECSFFYSKTFCLNCVSEHLKEFPIEIQSKIKKQIAQVNSSGTK